MEQSTALSLKVNEVKNNQMKHLKIQQALTHLYDEVKTIVKNKVLLKKLVAMRRERIERDFLLKDIFKVAFLRKF